MSTRAGAGTAVPGTGVDPAGVPGDLRLPGEPSLAGVLPDVARALGLDLPGLPTAGLALSAVERACVVLVDGLGWEALAARTGHAPTLRGMMRDATPIQVGYPSTTAASLGTFGTGASSGRTGLLGYTVRDPGGTGLVNLVSWTRPGDPQDAPPLDPRSWQRHTTVFERLVASGVDVTSVGPARFDGSGLTVAALRGGRFHGAESLADRVRATRAAARRPGLTYLYWGEVDKTGHRHGWQSGEWADALAATDAGLTQLLRVLPAGTAVVVTADHGMVDVTTRIDVASDGALRRDVTLVAGEPRASHIHLDDGADVAEVAARWAQRLGDDAWVLTREQALGLGLFGSVHEAHVALIGDLVVAARGTAAIVDSRTQTPASLALTGMHGSLTSAELDVPALVTVT